MMCSFANKKTLKMTGGVTPMKTNNTWRALTIVLTLALLSSLFSSAVLAAPSAAVARTFTILHTNDFHGQLDNSLSASNPGSARVATIVNGVRTEVGADNVLLVDAGDEMQGSLLSNLGDGTANGKGIPTIAVYNAMGYDAATFGNHEFDWGQTNLANRTTQATYPYLTANIVQNDTGNCSTAGWTPPTFADAAYQIIEVGVDPNIIKVGFIGVTTTEVPIITVSTATAGLCFKDPAESILHYYDAMKAAGAEVIVVLSHLGYPDGGYGYGIPAYGDQTLAARLNTAGKPANLIIGGHSHTDLTTATTVGTTKIVQASYNGRKVGREDITVGVDGSVSITYTSLKPYPSNSVTPPPTAKDPAIDALVTTYATDPAYLAIVNQPIGYTSVDLPRFSAAGGNGNTDNMMGTFIDDAIYDYLNTDAEPTNDVDIFFNNAGGIRTDWCYVSGVWGSTGCVTGLHDPALLTYGHMYTILPFGNATAVGQMTGAKILEVLNYAPNVAGVIQPAGLKYSYFKYTDALTGPYAWGAYDVTVYDKATSSWVPLDLTKTYNVGTNEFLAPAGGDGYNAFKYMTGITYWGDMLNAVNDYVTAHYGTTGTAYAGPNGDGTLDGRIGINGDGDTTFDGGTEIVPVTILHHNDSHGNLDKGSYVGYTQLATLIKQERGRNPTRTLLLSSGDNIQGDAMSYYFKTAPTGFTSNGTYIADSSMRIQPLIKLFNSMNYDAMTLGNHEYNFGKDVFASVFSQADFPILQANVSDDGSYGLAAANHGIGVQPYVEKVIGGDINVAIMGIGNHRIPNYELPSNIPGLTFSNPITTAQTLSATLRPTNDVLIALTHIGFTDIPGSLEVDLNVDTNLAAQTSGIDAIIGGHSHSDPSNSVAYPYLGNYKYLPSIVADADGNPVAVTQAYRYNSYLGEVSLGLRPLGSGNYEVVSQTGRYIAVNLAGTAEDAATNAIIDPYTTMLTAYNNTIAGQTTAPIDTMLAFTQETNGANLQADAAVYELETVHGIPVDFHLSGAMTNKLVAGAATPASPVTLKISDMFGAMPYENSLLVISMNGPQLKTVLERAYRNYYYYKYYPDYGGYSHYTTCMLDTNFGNRITYNDQYPTLPDGNNVVSLNIGGMLVDFTNASKYYNVSTVNYLAAGSCNFNNAGVSLWPLDQIVADTQYYVRDAVIDYTTFKGIVSPAIEGRLQYAPDTTAPTVISSVRTNSTPTKATSVNFTVTFSEAVTGVGTADFSLTSAGPLGATVTGVSGGPIVYTVTVNTGSGNGTIRLNVRASASVNDISGNPLAGIPYTSGEAYVVDKTAPVVTVPANIAGVEAINASGAAVTYGAATATDADPANPVASCLPVSGSTFPLGINTVTCSATDTAGNIGTNTFTITVVDTVAPVLTVPANMTANATSAAGAIVNFAPTATDTVDLTPLVACLPASGSVFPIGPTTVNCTATDDSTNVDSDSFTVTVQHNPSVIVLYAPANGEVLHYNLPTFDWSDYAGAIGYQIQIARNNTFTQLVVNATIATPVSVYTPTINLPLNAGLFWHVRAKLTPTTYSAWSEIRTLHTANPPSAPVLLSPANNLLIYDTTPTLDWRQPSVPAGATFDHYQIQVDNDADFSSPVVNENVAGLANHIYTPLIDLASNAKYYWRVRAWNTSGDYSSWSASRYFREAMLPPTLVAPIGGVTVGSLKPTLNWDDSAGATTYTVQISLNNTFRSLVVNTTTAVSEYTLTMNLRPGVKYYWRVIVNGPNGPSLWSTVENFMTP
jgi:2',3'-cyclic-nucleotide 2'-phosphodiesterase / 3'-nucleotidase / 5'-nucleotidase